MRFNHARLVAHKISNRSFATAKPVHLIATPTICRWNRVSSSDRSSRHFCAIIVPEFVRTAVESKLRYGQPSSSDRHPDHLPLEPSL